MKVLVPNISFPSRSRIEMPIVRSSSGSAARPSTRTIIGEPTGLTYCAGHKGIYKATLLAKGVPGHSSQPGGPSAIHELVGCCQRVLSADWGTHPRFGEGNLNLGLIGGGIAPRIRKVLDGGAFLRAFVEKGRFEPLLRRVPVHLVLDPGAPLEGAARWAAGLPR